MELRVRQLGVIEDVSVVLEAGMSALTGETGAGKTLLVDAIELLLGGPAEAMLVRPGAAEAVVEGRFARGPDDEVVLTRVVPSAGRSRAYVDGRMVAAAQLSELGRGLLDIHGQHAHQSLLSTTAQRTALDRSAGIRIDDVAAARRRLRQIDEARDALGGDPRARARELDLLRYQLSELEAARLEDPDEDERLQEEEDLLADASGLQAAASGAWQELTREGGLVDRLGEVVAGLAGRAPLAALRDQLRAAEVELSDVAAAARTLAEAVEDDPARLDEIGARRQVLKDLRKKFGDTLAEVIAYREEVRGQVAELASHDERAAALDTEHKVAEQALADAENRLWAARREAAPILSEKVQERLRELAMPKARFEVEVDDEPGGDGVVWKLGANPGEPVLPLTKVASGGELARTMLAVRLAVGPAGTAGGAGAGAESVAGAPAGPDAGSPAGPDAAPTDADDGTGPSTLVFDEVDAGIGGEAAVAVGQALAALGSRYQVLVVTHLPQVAAFADHQLVVRKESAGDRTVAEVEPALGPDRVVELSRMLSGSPGSQTARRHAEELLARAGRRKPRSGKR
jgi:DNA repair protein RecN (Recombination protein N)